MPPTPEEIEAERVAKEKADKEAAAKAAAEKAAEDEKRGYPLNTAPKDMTDAQQAAYWKARSRENEDKFTSRADYDELKAKAEEFDKQKAANATQAEKDVEEAHRKGVAEGSDKYLKDAVLGRFQGITGKTDDEIATIFEHVDPKSFTDDKGAIDSEKLKQFADTLGLTATGKPNADNYSKTIKDSRKPTNNSAGSIAGMRKQYREDHSTKKE